MKRLKLSSKAKTLEDLSSIIKTAKILPLYTFRVSAYKLNKIKIIEEIQNKFNASLIVRSSSRNEDNMLTSNAGGFESVMHIHSKNTDVLQEAIEKVISSYGDNVNSFDEVFVQPMLEDVQMSGVIFSSDIDTLSAYYIVNYDESGRTDSVTNGQSNELKNFICFKERTAGISDQKLMKLIEATKECEEIFENNFLDIEFAFSNSQLYIFQVRAIVINNKEDLSHINLSKSLAKLYNKIEKLNAPHPNLLGDKTIFGVMPDWNPAEIIGIRPKRLALSLYKELITDETWAYQRDNYGYRNLRSHPLLVSFLGVPFIDVRISFNSFIPKDLDESIATKLVNYYLGELSKNMNHHDKVEFKIIYSCYYFGLRKNLLKLKEFGLDQNDIGCIEKSLLNLTNNIIDIKDGLYKKDLKKVEMLQEKFNDIVNSELSIIDKIYWLIKDVKRYGTLPFAGIARAGFIAVQILKSLVKEKVIQEDDYEKFLNSLNTVSKQLSTDIYILNEEDFLDIYGHLRPGTYDILSLRYDEAYDIYFNSCSFENTEHLEEFSLSLGQKTEIDQLIFDNKLTTSTKDLMIFIKEAIEGREAAKFLFTKHLSQILKYIEVLGQRFDFSRDQLAYLDIQEVLNLYATLDHRDVKDIIQVDIDKNKAFYEYTKAVKLPSIIVSPNDIYSYYLEENEANFVTLKKIESSLVLEENISEDILEGKIVCIKSADPGYDYLFSKKIGGLITCYGGANSHMAIRCAEFGIPAVIGTGENNFSKYCKARSVEIDASNKNIKILS